MPRVKLGGIITPAQRRERFNKVVQHAMIERGIHTRAELADAVGMSMQAVNRRFNGTVEWQYSEICRLITALKLDSQAVLQMMGAAA